LLDSLDLERCRRSYLNLDEDSSTNYSRAVVNVVGNSGERDDNVNQDKNDSSSSMVTPLEKAVAMAHEITILELAEQNEVELAYATLRMCSEMLDRTLSVNNNGDDYFGDDDNNNNGANSQDAANIGMISSKSGDVERRITALSSMRRSASSTSDNTAALLPANYYGPSNPTKQKQRDQIAKLLKRHVPEVPTKRLSSLLQQSVKWQCHTGTFPTVQRLFQQKMNDDENKDDKLLEEQGDNGEGTKKKKRKNKNIEQKFDLVLGNVDIINGDGKRKRKKDGTSTTSNSSAVERIPSRPHQTIRLGKKSYIESACFLPNGRGLVTGSSDGFIEVWGEEGGSPPSPSKDNKDGDGGAAAGNADLKKSPLLLATDTIDFEKLRTSDLPYQRNDDLMMHESSILAMDVSHDGTLLGTTSSDGTVCVWKILDGKLLRKMERAHGGIGGVSDKGAAVTCIQFSPDGSKILTGGHDATCREFGLLTSRMLKEFRGHKSYVNCCSYVVLPHSLAMAAEGGSGSSGMGGGSTSNSSNHHGVKSSFLAVVTASADGSVCVWDGRTAEPIREIIPPIPTSTNAVIHDKDSIAGSKSIHTVVHLHSPPNTMIVVPRCDRAYLMSYSGAVLRVFTRDDVAQGSNDFLAATVSPSNQWLFVAADDGKCVVFDIHSSKVEKIIRSFAEDCSSGRSSEKPCEVSGLVCHPHRGLLGGYSNDKGQKRGILTLWK